MSSKNKLSLAANRSTVGRLVDSDSDSDLFPAEDADVTALNNGNDQDVPPNADCPWQSAEDPTSGKTYYYHTETRETQWSKPAEMGSQEERAALAAKEKRQKDFFSAMEANILNTISQGFKAPEKKNRLDTEFENREISDDPLDVSSGMADGDDKDIHISPRRGSGRMAPAAGGSRPDLIRTISSMDSGLLSELIKRVPSSRHVIRGTSQSSIGGGRQQSNKSLGRGSSHHSATGRKGRIMRGIGSGPVIIKKPSQSTIKDFDDDEPPPLTVVTTPDLRRRGSHSKVSSSHNPRDNLSRDNSLTMDQLTGGSSGGGGSGGNLGDLNFLDASNSSRASLGNLNNSSFNLEDSGGLLSHLSSSHNRSLTDQGFGGSFGSLDDSERSFGGASATHQSVASNLLPVQEGNEFDNSPSLKMETGSVMEVDGEDDDDSPDEGSFSFGAGSGEITASWLDALPTDGSARGEDMVGYGANAKPFKDAGFTSFFDESMANFDLSDKETHALQKLALISEQMTQVLESEEDSEESEDEDSSTGSYDMENMEFPKIGGGPVEYEMSFGGDDFKGVPLTPSFNTPKTTETLSTTASADSPINRPPPRRTLGAKTGGVPRQLKSIEPLDDNDTKASSRKLPIGGLALTIDNARGHFGESKPMSIQMDNARGLASPTKSGKTPRRHIGGSSSGRPSLVDVSEFNTSSSSFKSSSSFRSASSIKSSKSTSSKNMNIAARRLSMFRLKNVDRSKLRHVGKVSPSASKESGPDKEDGKPRTSLVGADLQKRPELVRRNTCGTLYVGTTMSAPDKDATIKCVCGVFRAHILQSELSGVTPESLDFPIFNDLEAQQKQCAKRRGADYNRSPTAQPIPSLEQISTFYRDVFQRAQMEYDCIIISLIYVERLIKTTHGALRPSATNWRSILFSCMVLASKVWDDLSMWNADFSQTCPNGVKFSLKRINELEIAILSALSYKVKVPASEYAKYYFLLRSMLIKSGLVGDEVDPSTPLDIEGAKRLQQVSTQFQSGIGATRREMRKAKSMRCKSMGEDERWKLATGARRAGAKNTKVSLEHVVQM